MSYRPIANYGIIGDLHTAALVGMDGSIDFMCLPHFDSPTIFAALLDHQKGGSFRIAPQMERVRHKQMYLPDSPILLTRFLGNDGVGEVSDFMPITNIGHSHDLVRRAKAVLGEVRFQMVLAPRFNCGRAGHRIELKDGEVLFVSEGEDRTALRLRTAVAVRMENGDATAEFTLRAGETASFVLEEVQDGKEGPSCSSRYVTEAFKQTLNFWHQWVGRSKYQGRWREMVNRSAITLKLLTSAPHGSMVAAPTFGLPEDIGRAAVWLASDDSDYIHGTTLFLDGGMTLYPGFQTGG